MTKKIWIHAGLIIAMFIVACIYLSPALGGKVIRQGDVQKYEAMSYKQRMEKERTGVVPNWTESMFSGMPGYHVTSKPQKSVFNPLRNTLNMQYFGWDRNIGMIFLYLLGFYVALLAFGLSPWLAFVGALGFGFASYNLIIIEAGHITKGFAMSMMAPILGGMYLALRSACDKELTAKSRRMRILWGSILFTLALILQISFNHIQITFYTAIACVFMGIAYLVYSIIKHRTPAMLLSAAILVVCAALAFGSNTRMLLVNEEYAHYTMRGGNELTVTPDMLYNEHADASAESTTTGLDINYAFSWSYGVGETYTILVPGAYGGGSGEKINTSKSSFYNEFRSSYGQYQYPWGEMAPLYWGDQPFTSGPVYFGAIIIMLFIMGLIVTRGPERWWMLAASLLAILLSWGNNLMGFNEWVFNNVPFYNKFRTPSMALVLANVCMALLAALTLKNIFAENRNRKLINKGLYIASGLLAVVIVVVLATAGSFSYTGASDQQLQAMFGPNWETMKAALASDRAALLRSDSLRSLLFIILAAATLWLCNNDKLKKGIGIAIIGVLLLVDLVGVDLRYLNKDNFTDKHKVELRRDQWDYSIDEQATAYGDHDYRVFNLAVNTYNDSKPSAFHNQIGGYSAAKLSRYQNLIDFYLSRHINPQVLNMLNTRYIVDNQGQVHRNPDALGNCWFVAEVKEVQNANEEILALNEINPATTAISNKTQFPDALTSFSTYDSTAIIRLEPSKTPSADYLRYTSHSAVDGLAVFSEIYYEPDWVAYLDGKKADYIRVDYVLRAMVVPAGDHVIEFKNEAPRMMKLDRITLVISLLTLLLMIGAVALTLRYNKKEDKTV